TPVSPASGASSRNQRSSQGAAEDRRAASGSEAFPTWTSAPDWRAYTRAFASAYASYDPCQSRWSGARFSNTETFGGRCSCNASWKGAGATASAPHVSLAASENG